MEGTVAVVIGDGLKLVNGQIYCVHDVAAATPATVKTFAYALTADATGAGTTRIASIFLTGIAAQV
jgi:hypothetical protein